MGGHVMGRVRPHGTKFQDEKGGFMQANAFLSKEYGTMGIQLDGDDQNQKNRRKHDHDQRREHKVNQAFDDSVV